MTTTYRNGHSPAIRPMPAGLTPADREVLMIELDQWDSEIAALDQAHQDEAAAQLALTTLSDTTEARAMLADARRRVAVLSERCRLHAAAIAIGLGRDF